MPKRRVRALESLLTEKGYVDPAAVDSFTEIDETKIGPRNGAKVSPSCFSSLDRLLNIAPEVADV